MIVTSPAHFIASVLEGGLWHTTSQERYEIIAHTCALRVNPSVPDSLRHKTANGAANYPFVRTLGGVSLFSFSGFDQDEYQSRCPLSNWQTFVPVYWAWESALWIEIDRAAVGSAIIDAEELLEKWKINEAYGHTLMPHIEAAHIGDLPASAFRSVHLATKTAPSEWNVARL